MKNVGIDEVIQFTETPFVTGSFLQENRHTKVTERYQPIQPAAIGQALSDKGFSLVSLLTGKGRHEDKVDFQRTISRYRSADAFGIDGLDLDIIYISKHMGRGCDELRLGLYRGVCANQWAVGKLFDIIRFRHTGNPAKDIQAGIDSVLSQRAKLVETVQKMQATLLNETQVAQLAEEYARIRLGALKKVVSVDFKSLQAVRRTEDVGTDLFTVANVLQENVINQPLQYGVNSLDRKGNPTVRSMHTRKYRESSAQLVELNSQLFDAALKLVA